MSRKLDPLQFLTGFLMGGFFGFTVECLLLISCRLVYTWLGRPGIELAWWMPVLLIPLPVWFGLTTGKAIASMHLEDY